MVSYFFIKTDEIGLKAGTKKIPKINDKVLGIIIIEKFDKDMIIKNHYSKKQKGA